MKHSEGKGFVMHLKALRMMSVLAHTVVPLGYQVMKPYAEVRYKRRF